MLFKYPRTPHLPFSKGMTSDDKVLKNTEHFIGKEVVVTEKMDGENTTIYSNNYHARSLDCAHRSYHSYLLGNILPLLQPQLPEGYRICGEYLYATHSIFYDNLDSYFQLFSIWDENNYALSWEDTKILSSLLGVKTVPELYVGTYDESKIKKIANEVVARGGEGIVVRLADSFHYNDFSKSIAKYVRENHVQTNAVHWSLKEIEKNELKERNDI